MKFLEPGVNELFECIFIHCTGVCLNNLPVDEETEQWKALNIILIDSFLVNICIDLDKLHFIYRKIFRNLFEYRANELN